MERCSHCRAQLPLAAAQCPSCGRSVLSTPQPAAVAAEPAVAEPMAMPVVAPTTVEAPSPVATPVERGWTDVHPGTTSDPAAVTPPTQTRPMNDKAMISLALGVSAYIFLWGIGALAAVIVGHIARKEIRRSGDAESGSTMAMIGLILGYFQLICAALFFAVIIYFASLGLEDF